MASLARKRHGWIGCALIACVLVACEIAPAPPLLSPIEVTGSYGYSDVALGEDRYQVSYVTPSVRALRSPNARAEAVEAQRKLAYDLALWHAAQIALAHGFVGFRVGNVRTNVDTMVDEYDDPFFYGPGFSRFHRFWGPTDPYWGPYGGPSPYIYVRLEVVMDVTLLHSLGPGDYDARDTIAQLSKTYPGAAGPAPQGPAQAPPG